MRHCSICKRLLATGSPNIGPATVFISWGLKSKFYDLIIELKARVAAGVLGSDAFVWVCTTSIRQHDGEGKQRDVRQLGAMVERCDETLLFNDVWDRMVTR